MMKKQVLFLCTGNSARSQLAEAIFNHMAGEMFHAESAGVHPSDVDTRVFDVLKAHQISHEELRSKDYAEVEKNHYDFVITLCDNAKDECVIFDQDIDQLHWNLVDPKPLEGVEPFQNTAKELIERISLFLLLNRVSRHLALLRDTTFLKDTRHGLWIHYRLSPSLPMWIKHLLQTVRVGNPGIINAEKSRLKAAQNNEQ
ncbi:phosphotyrosine protein phosphatase [Vibrio campbellii]|uniref:arsenate reductase/protein-tyrosine-phosphatase family protein n=1 Tax=Vibrio campbellii TaxID=680 RepID=UPI002F42168D